MKFFLVIISLISTLFATEKVSLQLKWKNSFQFAGFYIAKEKGFYKKAGLDVDIKELKHGTNIVNSVLNHKSTYGVGDSSLIYYRIMKKPVVALMPIYEHSPLSLLTTDVSIKSLKDLKGKKFIINPMSLKNPSILAMLAVYNIYPKDFKIVDSNVFSLNKILKEKNRIFAVYSSNQPYFLKLHHIPYKLFSPLDNGIDFYGDVLFTSESEINNHPNRTIRFIQATKEGWNYAFNHLNETINLVYKKYNSQHEPLDMIRYEANILKKLRSKNYKFNKQKVMEITTLYKVILKLKGLLNYNDFIFNPFIVTKKEKEFLKTHKIRCISTDSWEPFNLRENGKLSGIAIDYWNLVSKKLNLNSTCKTDDNFLDVLNAIKNKKADITISTSETKNRKKYAVFSIPYATFPIVIATRNNVGFIHNINQIKNKKIAVAKGYTATKLLQEKYPHLHYIYTKTTDEALKLVSEGKAYASIDILPVIAYKINFLSLNNLKIAGKTEFNFPVKFMVRKDYSELIPMINRSISSITKHEEDKIYSKWIHVNMQNGYSNKHLNKILLITLSIIIVLVLWSFTLIIQISKRKKAEKELEKLAHFDELTSIFNRRQINLTLDRQIHIANRYHNDLSIIFFDIDHFKNVNDTFGHDAGDKVLIKISQLVQNQLRKSDTFGRWGGEEFLIILPETSQENAYKVAENLRKVIENNDFEEIGKITCSFGVYQISIEDNLESAIKKVDNLLYKAKESGRNQVVMQK